MLTLLNRQFSNWRQILFERCDEPNIFFKYKQNYSYEVFWTPTLIIVRGFWHHNDSLCLRAKRRRHGINFLFSFFILPILLRSRQTVGADPDHFDLSANEAEAAMSSPRCFRSLARSAAEESLLEKGNLLVGLCRPPYWCERIEWQFWRSVTSNNSEKIVHSTLFEIIGNDN